MNQQQKKNLRTHLFSLYDSFTGSKIGKHLEDFEKLSKLGAGDIETRHEHLFKNLIAEASEYVPAFASYRDYETLARVPVLSKDYLKSKYNSFFSEKYSRKNLIEARTSGSYGTPFSFYMTAGRKARQQAEIIYFGKLSGYYVGQKHAYVRSTVKSDLKLKLQNELLISPDIVNERWLEKTRQRLADFGTELIIGYPTVIGNIASYCVAKGYGPSDFRVEGVITTSEPLTEMARNTISACFGVPVRSRYSSEEQGVIGQEREVPGLHLINHFTHIVEILKLDSNQSAEPGELGRVVVTDLYNKAFPLIRYDTGDLAEYVSSAENKYGLPAIQSLQGRAIELIYTTGGERITPMAINGVFRDCEDADNIVQYQFIQEDRTVYRLLLQLIGDSLNTEPIMQYLKKLLGRDASIEIEYVSHIPPLKSGKRPYIINRYKQQETGK